MLVIKRDGHKQNFDFNKIRVAVEKAFLENKQYLPKKLLEDLEYYFYRLDEEHGLQEMHIEDIQDIVERSISEYDWEVSKAYMLYRYEHSIRREKSLIEQVSRLFDHSDEYLMKENANKKAELTNVQQSYLAELLGAHYVRTKVFTKDVLKAHDDGAIHIHDMGSCAEEGVTNCSLLNLEDALYNGTVLNEFMIEPQKKFRTACTVATQIIQGVAGLQYGGITITMTHLVKALKMTLERIKKDQQKYHADESYIIDKYREELTDGIQTFMYQVNSMYTTQGWVWPL